MPQTRASISHPIPDGTHPPVRPLTPVRNQRVTVSLPVSLIERLRNAVYWTGDRALASLIAEALDDIVTAMEEDNGGAFPQRLSPLKRGRRQGKRTPDPSTTPRFPQLVSDKYGLVEDSVQSHSDLPDGILQSLFVVGLNLQAFKRTKSRQHSEIADAPLHRAVSQLTHVISEIRSFMEGRE